MKMGDRESEKEGAVVVVLIVVVTRLIFLVQSTAKVISERTPSKSLILCSVSICAHRFFFFFFF